MLQVSIDRRYTQRLAQKIWERKTDISIPSSGIRKADKDYGVSEKIVRDDVQKVFLFVARAFVRQMIVRSVLYEGVHLWIILSQLKLRSLYIRIKNDLDYGGLQLRENILDVNIWIRFRLFLFHYSSTKYIENRSIYRNYIFTFVLVSGKFQFLRGQYLRYWTIRLNKKQR